MTLSILFIILAIAAPNKTDLKSALAQNRLSEVKQMGAEGYRGLQTISQSISEPMEQRWRATLAMAKIGHKESLVDLEQFLKSPTWYMRSASLLGMALVDSQLSQQKAKELLNRDPALLVRASALQVLSQKKEMDREFLWKELHNPINFRRGQSLSIRTSILQLLSKHPLAEEKEKFALLAKDSHPEIKKISKDVLVRL
jgi:hypothetical protein